MHPQVGEIVHVRSRKYLVEDFVPPPVPGDSLLVRLSCLEDDAQGEQLEVLWDLEIDAFPVGQATWDAVANRGFDDPKLFSAYIHSLRWNCVTSTNPNLFQAPYRAGIQVMAYQLEPLRKALKLPRVNLFIADDVGLGKTIEAGLIARELLMRQKVRRIVVICPPSVVRQWHDEMQERFGLRFRIYDRDFVAACRRERGYAINPFTTHNRFILSQAVVRDEAYAAPLRDWLGDFSSGAMLILDEAHNAAPASGSKYATDSKFTRAIRDLAHRFEHRLFLSATPHNGHSNSFAALLEILDPQRFCRGVPVKSPKLLDAVMVRRLKQDLRGVGTGDFPDRKVVPIVVDGLPDDAPELALSRLLQSYRMLREERLRGGTRSRQAAAMLVITSLQKRLLSSIEAFARTLQVHRKAMRRRAEQEQTQAPEETQADAPQNLSLLGEAAGADDDRAELPEEEVDKETDAQVEAATEAGAAPGHDLSPELALLDEMAEIAAAARYQRDGRVERLLDWVREHQCPGLGRPDAPWTDVRVLIFTEYTDTKRYLVEQLSAAIGDAREAAKRINTFHGGMGEERREQIKAAFNSEPDAHALRILVATDAAREGINLQNHCADLFHFDIPWNPSRMEQRNGRIDRKLQRAEVVHCHYFVLPQRAEDRVLDVLVRKTKTIHKELGSLSPVVERRLSRLLDRGIRHDDERQLRVSIDEADQDAGPGKGGSRQVIKEELEEARVRQEALERQIADLRGLLDESRRWISLDDRHFRDALSASLEILGAEPLRPADAKKASQDPERATWFLPALHERLGADPTWATTLDTLRAPIKKGQKRWEWRKEAPIRPVVFKDPETLDGRVVHLHLEQRVVQRLLGRFLAQGFLHHELTRACVVRTDDTEPKVIALGRLSLFGRRAARLHDEVLAVAAQWQPPKDRGRRKLRPLKESDKMGVLELLEESLASERLQQAPESVRRMLAAGAQADVTELAPHLERRAEVLTGRAVRQLTARGEKEAKEMLAILEAQRDRIVKRKEEVDKGAQQLLLGFARDEQRQLEADRKHWEARLKSLAAELDDEPVRIRASYEVKARRVEPVGLVYLWPVSG